MKKGILIALLLVVSLFVFSGCSGSSSSSSYRNNNRNNNSYSDQQFREDYAYFEGRWDAMTGR